MLIILSSYKIQGRMRGFGLLVSTCFYQGICIFVVRICKLDSEYEMFISDFSDDVYMQGRNGKETELTFRRLLVNSGYSEKAMSELWKWYDPTNKKGAASF
jgi:hypothetical protein